MSRISQISCTIVVLLYVFGFSKAARNRIACYDAQNRPKRCLPPFVNAAFDRPVDATDTCGLNGPEEYCVQTSIIGGSTKSCEICNSRNSTLSHPPQYLTDFHNVNNLTWWQSSTMLADIQYPNSVNLTLPLGKAFEITYVRLKFYSSRPESFAIYKRTNEGAAWEPYQFYSASCSSTYRLRTNEIITRDNEKKAICVDQFSDISPLSGGNVPFSTLEGRPSAYDFDNSPELQDWVTATDIRIVLNRLNTYGDEVFGDYNVLRSYFYGISDFAIGGRCKCNGHASDCRSTYGLDGRNRLECVCEHRTQGPDCGECQTFYNDQPWHRATANNAYECQPCDCSGLSERCFFDEELYRRTQHGGHCLECRNNTAGPNCERCKDNFYRRYNHDRCEPCNCDPVGSESTQCDAYGRCTCKRGVTGERCDRCEANHYDFGNWGCRECGCNEAGSRDNNPVCQPGSGQCSCKENVEGLNCDVCKPGYFGLSHEDPLGCMACFCHGHSSVCSSAQGYSQHVIHSDFGSGQQQWTGMTTKGNQEVPIQYNGITENIGISAPTVDAVYFSAPSRYLGNQRFSYNQFLTFKLRLGEDGARPGNMDVILEGNGLRVSLSIFSQGNPVPQRQEQTYRFRLNEHDSYGWKPTLTSQDFLALLSDLQSIKIRGTYTPQGVGFLDEVHMESARQRGSGEVSKGVEYCQCPEGYVGQFCESCGPGYHRDPSNGGPYSKCIPCNCNGHSDDCDVNTGRCLCQHNTVGEHCERCDSGYYGYALAGTPDDCQPCPCPNQGDCVQLLTEEVACINCDDGYTGNRCEFCDDGYYGDPQGSRGAAGPCRKCNCNENIDYNAVGNCDRFTGECLKCIYNTGGFSCERCLAGYYGDALDDPRGQCLACACYPAGTLPSAERDGALSCDERSGQCPCQRRVVGNHCDMCDDGFWNIDSGRGCDACNCNPMGSYNRSCDLRSGQCHCKPGVSGRKCDECLPNFWGFSRSGCLACDCNMEGSTNTQCDRQTGQCICFPSIEGEKCDRCVENKYNITAGCIDCPACYGLVQEQVIILRSKLNELRVIIRNIGDNPAEVDDADFRGKLAAVNQSVYDLYQDALNAGGDGDTSLGQQMEALTQAIQDITTQCGKITTDISYATTSTENGQIDIQYAEEAIDIAENALLDAENYLMTEGQRALQEAIDELKDLDEKSAQLTKIAGEAREEAMKQEEQATMIEETANKALNTSREALTIARDVLRKPDDLSSQIEDLRQQVLDTEVEYQATKSDAERAERLSEEAKSESLSIFSDVKTLTIPDIDTGALYDQADLIKQDSATIKQEAMDLMEQHVDLMTEVDVQKNNAYMKLDQGYEQQAITDELLADADHAKAIAEEAIATAEETLHHANITYYTLLDFNQNVEENERKAKEAQRLIPEIEDRIREAEDKTQVANNNLADAVRDAQAAKEIAIQAQDTAEKASDDASDIRVEAEGLKDTAESLNYEAQDLAARASEAERRLESYEGQANSDSQRVDEALKKAHEAQESAKSSSEKVEDAMKKVKDILLILEKITMIDEERLDELELNLAQAKQELVAANFNERYMWLQVALSEQERWVGDGGSFFKDLELLTNDVENIRIINDTIPRKCFKKIELEPTLPPIAG